jgi:hypothetical protein
VPELDFAVLSIAATENNETFNLLGAGIEEVRVAQLPMVTLVYLTARWDWGAVPVGTDVTVGVTCRSTETGALLYENTLETSVSAENGVALPARLLMPLPLHLTSWGLHAVELSVLRRSLKRIEFVVKPQG